MIDPKKVWEGIMRSLWPGGSRTPSIGPMKDQKLAKADENIKQMSEASAATALVAASQGVDMGIPLDSLSITITDIGTEEIIGLTTPSSTSVAQDSPPGGDNVKGHAIIRVSNIATMTEDNRDNLNKQLFFCLRDNDGNWFIGVWHRYLEGDVAWNIPPGYSEDEWWPTWKVECGRLNHEVEQHIFGTYILEGDEIEFLIEWENGTVDVTDTGTGNSVSLTAERGLSLDKTCVSGECSKWTGEFSSADVEEIEFEVETE